MSVEASLGAELRDQVTRLLDREHGQDAVAQADRGAWNSPLWGHLEALGLPHALAAESSGGAGLRLMDAHGVFEALGEYAVNLPLGETMLANWLLGEAGLPLGEGPVVLSSGVIDLENAGDSPASRVAWPGIGARAVALGCDGAEVVLMCFERIGEECAMPAGHFDPLCWRLSGKAPIRADVQTEGLLPHLAILRAVQMGGALRRMLALSSDYAAVRKQFGQPLNRFQAVGGLLASLAISASSAAVAGQMAVAMAAHRPRQAAAIAKTTAGRAAARGLACAHQIHGAMGVTREYALQYYSRLIWRWRDEAGSEGVWAEILGQDILAHGEGPWDAIVKWRAPAAGSDETTGIAGERQWN